MMRAALATALAVIGGLSTTGAQSSTMQTLFAAYQPNGPRPCYRQPVLIVQPGGQNIVALVEGRNNSYCSGSADGSNSSIIVRSSADGGNTWSDQVELYHGGTGAKYGQPDYLSGIWDGITNRVYVIVQASPNIVSYSDDNGATWTAPVPAQVTLPSGVSATPGVAHGIQLNGTLCSEPTCNGHVGRLVLAFVCHHGKEEGVVKMLRAHVKAQRLGLTDVSCAGCYSCLGYSDDHGATWTVTAGGMSNQDGTRESSIVQLYAPTSSDAAVYATERNMGNATGHRLHAISTDSGVTFSQFGSDAGIPDGCTANWTGIVAGATRFDTAASRRIVISTPRSLTSRSDLALYSSDDEGNSWSAGSLYLAGPSGYSDTAQVNATHAAVLFENGPQEFAQQISFGWYTTADL